MQRRIDRELKVIPFRGESAGKHLNEILLLDKLFFRDDAWREENFLRRLPSKGRLSKVAVLGDALVGYMIGSAYHRRGHIHRLVVNPVLQRMGVGTKLLTAFSKECHKLGLEEVTAEASSGNVAPNRFYMERGFRRLEGEGLEQYLVQKGRLGRIALYRPDDGECVVYIKSVK